MIIWTNCLLRLSSKNKQIITTKTSYQVKLWLGVILSSSHTWHSLNFTLWVWHFQSVHLKELNNIFQHKNLTGANFYHGQEMTGIFSCALWSKLENANFSDSTAVSMSIQIFTYKFSSILQCISSNTRVAYLYKNDLIQLEWL